MLWRIFCQTGTFRGVFSIHISNNGVRISAAAMGGGKGHYINKKEKKKTKLGRMVAQVLILTPNGSK
jgi:hypothetical protein